MPNSVYSNFGVSEVQNFFLLKAGNLLVMSGNTTFQVVTALKAKLQGYRLTFNCTSPSSCIAVNWYYNRIATAQLNLLRLTQKAQNN
ncbi:MAG: hypothetical protein F6K40_28870 [Okeania sp. SIO3I5]|uniref:hypothetical protein n=1 Tax=Okeania sp. SIO3I5 TaxID=2607805 RepID=UPI0013BDB3D9|nr:hypothetical protein [Okeania sp. SIO3I5]NEQ40039.1 hypothetical protein [Okeania sp. SIO3I5]